MRALFISLLLVGITSFAQDKVSFKKAKLEIAGKQITVELAESPRQLQYGLMYRTNLPENQGMLFSFRDERIRSFWMRNTFIDLSIGYFDAQKKLVDIQEMNAVKSEMEANPPRYKSRVPAQFALEMNKGWFKRNKIKLGTSFRLIQDPKH